MRFSLSFIRRFLGVMLVGLMGLTQVGCAARSWSPSLLPNPEEPGPQNPADRDTGGASAGKIIGFTILGAVGGYMVYNLLKADPGGEEDGAGSAEVLPKLRGSLHTLGNQRNPHASLVFPIGDCAVDPGFLSGPFFTSSGIRWNGSCYIHRSWNALERTVGPFPEDPHDPSKQGVHRGSN